MFGSESSGAAAWTPRMHYDVQRADRSVVARACVPSTSRGDAPFVRWDADVVAAGLDEGRVHAGRVVAPIACRTPDCQSAARGRAHDTRPRHRVGYIGWREDRSGYLTRDPVSPAIGSRMESRPSHALPPLAREQDTLARFSGSGEPQGLTISIHMLILVIPSNDMPTTTWGVPTPAPHLRRRTPRAR